MLEIAVLGLLNQSPMHGYELRKRLASLLGTFRAFSYGSLYPTLRKLSEAGWITEEAPLDLPSTTRSRRGKRVYRLTAEGKEHFAELLSEVGPEAFDDEGFGARLAFFAQTRSEISAADPRRTPPAGTGAAGAARPHRRPLRSLHRTASPARPRIGRARSALADRVDRERKAGAPTMNKINQPQGGTLMGSHNVTSDTGRTPSGKIRVGIIGVGNCAASLVQGVHFYRDADPSAKVPGLMHVNFGPYHVSDIEFVAAFDVDAKKVGLDLSQAIVASENNTIKILRRPAARRSGPAWSHARRPRQVLPRDDHRIRRAAGRRRQGPQGPSRRRPDLLPAGRFRGGGEVLRAVRHRRPRRLRQRAAGVHRQHAGVGSQVRGGRRPDRRRRHQVTGRRHHHPPRPHQAVRGPRRRGAAHVSAQCRRQHGLQEHVGARPARVEEDQQDPVGHLAGSRPRPRRTQRPHRPVRLRGRGWTTASGPSSDSRARRSAMCR